MDNTHQIIAEEIKREIDWATTALLMTEPERNARIGSMTTLALNVAARFALCDLTFDSNEFLTMCGLR